MKEKSVAAIVKSVNTAAINLSNNLNYRLIRSRRRTLCVEIRDGCVVVRSPLYLPQPVINKFIVEKSSWIESKLSQMSELGKPQQLFLGEQVEILYGSFETVSPQKIILKSLGETELEKKRVIENFYRRETTLIVENFLDKYKNFFDWGKISFKKYRSKWGSCDPRNNLCFNIYLSMCPLNVIEYIVVHELAHTKIKNHSRIFYAEVAENFPDYKQALKWLRAHRGLI